MIFDLVLYALAIAATLAFVGGHRTEATATRPIHRTLEVLHNIGEALPDEVFATDTEASEVEAAEELPSLEELFTRADEIQPSEPATDEPEQDDFADLLAVGRTAPATDWLSCNIRQLKAIASLYKVPKFNRLRKDELIAALA